MIQFLVNSNYNNYVPSSRGRPKSDLIWLYVHVGESRHGNLGTYSRDGGSGDGADMGQTPLLQYLVTGHIIYRITIQENEVP